MSDKTIESKKEDLQVIDYMIDCTLATVEKMLFLKNISKNEFRRQCSIAQHAINYLGPTYLFTSRAEQFAKEEITAFEYYSKLREKYQIKEQERKNAKK